MKEYLSTQQRVLLLTAGVLQLIAFGMMALDPAPSGFGVLTLWISPIVLIVGLMLPVVAFSDSINKSSLTRLLKNDSLKTIGFFSSFIIAFITYLLTLEPTASLWDCSETLAAAFKLQVPHTPGTPMTLLLGRLFSMLAMGDVTKVAWFINLMSGFFSSLAVAITFLIIWYLGSRFINSKIALITGSLIGALILTFSDSFWFSAVEAETYGPSVFFMVLLVWLSIPTESMTKEKKQKRVLFISYLLGIAYCIHPMSILILPVCVIFWQLPQDQKASWKSLGLSFVIGVVIILFISKVVAVSLFEWAFLADLFVVNKLSLPVYSGVFVLIAILGGTSFVLWNKLPKVRLSVLAVVFIVAGFSPYLMLFIRSAQLPPINEFTPGNLAKIKPYMNRESYPGRPLVYGPYYDAQITDVTTKAQSYVLNDGGYKEVGEVPDYQYDSDRMTILPRIYSNDPSHVKVYQQWTGLQPNEKPKFSDNLKFLFSYQVGHMYLRYLLWNFAGRVSDEQHADWSKPWYGLADREAIAYNRANNQYFLLPLFLGLFGFFIHSRRDRSGFVANLAFFLITGLLLTIYLNGTPNEPRERDYIYVGSYLAFSIWAGIGAMWIASRFEGKKAYISSLLILIPGWMMYQNWDDHDRSDRTFQVDYARAVLGSCEEGAILFTGGDNDTFPLWYLQEVEGFRTDVRVKVLSYFNADWYINQLSRPYYDSPPFELTLKTGDNEYGPYDPVYIQERMTSVIDWNKYMKALNARNPNLMFRNRSSELFFLPSRKVSLKTPEGEMGIEISGSYLPKSEMAILDIIASNDWTRPIYFNFTSINSLKINMKDYVVQEGLVYKLQSTPHTGREIPVDLDQSYENLVLKANYSNLANSSVYFNYEDYHARMINPLRFAFNQLISEYLKAGLKEKAQEVTKFAYQNLYFDHLRPSYADLQMGQILRATGEEDQGEILIRRTIRFYQQHIEDLLATNQTPSRNDLAILQEGARLLNDPQVNQAYSRLIAKIR
ncbi:MAG: hypothetical protein CMB80_31625 [Flammeovirgaceae bacterium]|nr:hypothetical protein [Flammeovirgaceae bacterium]MBE61749.1 hypothetical protein [Flammeovirgaceae bacterium]HCX24090.1 hypothetical protein [Cytophagales bacterium]